MSKENKKDKKTKKTARGNWLLWLSALAVIALIVVDYVLRLPGWFLPASGAFVLIAMLIILRSETLAVKVLRAYCSPLDIYLDQLERQAQYAVVVENMDKVLEHFNLGHFDSDELEDLKSKPPDKGDRDIPTCAGAVASKRYASVEDAGSAARVSRHKAILELLYRDFCRDYSHDVWTRCKKYPQTLLALGKILVDSQRLPESSLELEAVDLQWLLERIGDDQKFRMQLVATELGVVNQLWDSLCHFAAFLNERGLQAQADFEMLKKRLSMEAGPLSALDSAGLATRVLRAEGERWIKESEGIKPHVRDWVPLSIVSLGIFSAERSSQGTWPVSTMAGGDNVAPDVLVSYLWKKSLKGAQQPSLLDLANESGEWHAQAAKELGPGLHYQLREVVKSRLASGTWPNWMPIELGIHKVKAQNEYILKQGDILLQQGADLLLKGKDATEWQEQVKELLEQFRAKQLSHLQSQTWITELLGQMQTQQKLDPGTLKSWIDKLEKTISERLKEFIPPAAAVEVSKKATLDEATEEAARQLDSFTFETFCPETRLTSFQVAVDSTIEWFGRLNSEITRRLATLRRSFLGDAYLITFDATKGELSKVIDELKDAYGFEYYTRYSRIGQLPAGRSFEDFYRQFEKDLEAKIEEYEEEASELDQAEEKEKEKLTKEWERKWGSVREKVPNLLEKVEITVQPVSLSLRHDFAGDVSDHFKQLDKKFKILRHPPSITYLYKSKRKVGVRQEHEAALL